MKTNPLFVIRGTGFAIDGTLVEKVNKAWVNEDKTKEFFFVRPYNREDFAKQAFVIADKYLQPVQDNKEYEYKITVEMISIEENGHYLVRESSKIIPNAFRKLDIEALTDKLVADLTPLVRI